MEKTFLMGSNDFLTRNPSNKISDTFISNELKQDLLKICMKEAFSFYENFFNINSTELDLDMLFENYIEDLEEANSFNLFQVGGVREKDHVNFWCLSKVLSPQLYVESGVFIGSSLHAFSKTSTLEKIIAIDPNLNALKIPKQNLPTTEFIGNQDFSQIEIEDIPENSLVYFDDHINTASRIIQAKQKGFKYLLFDDSTGLEGVCQRLYPATPTVPMIVNWEILKPSHVIEWTWSSPVPLKNNLKNRMKKIMGRSLSNKTRVQLKIDKIMIEQCKEANSLIKQYSKIPDFGEFLPQRIPEGVIDTTKYIIELVD